MLVHKRIARGGTVLFFCFCLLSQACSSSQSPEEMSINFIRTLFINHTKYGLKILQAPDIETRRNLAEEAIYPFRGYCNKETLEFIKNVYSEPLVPTKQRPVEFWSNEIYSVVKNEEFGITRKVTVMLNNYSKQSLGSDELIYGIEVSIKTVDNKQHIYGFREIYGGSFRGLAGIDSFRCVFR